MMDGSPRQGELAALPDGATQRGLAGVQEEIADFALLPPAPGCEFLIEKLGGAADPGR
jgi:hypothetical protein